MLESDGIPNKNNELGPCVVGHAAIGAPCVTRSDDMRQTAVDAQISDE